jgi:hypothetical protein
MIDYSVVLADKGLAVTQQETIQYDSVFLAHCSLA